MKDIYRATTADAGDFLDQNSHAYLESNPVAPDKLTSRFHPLSNELINPSTILTIGVGVGDEIQSLNKMYPQAKLYGIDLSQTAIEKAKDETQHLDDTVEYQIADAQRLPFGNDSFDAVVMSALLHEVYSYSPNGNEAISNAVQEAARIIKPEGIILVRDPKAPSIKTQIELHFKSQFAVDFYDYFRKYFRTFDEWNDETKNEMLISQNDKPDFPIIDNSRLIQLSSSDTAELLLHFRNFWHAYSASLLSMGNPRWKELQERYLPLGPNKKTLSMDEYILLFEDLANQALSPTSNYIKNIRRDTSNRPKTDTFLLDHFDLSSIANDSICSLEIVQDMTQSMELSFKKN